MAKQTIVYNWTTSTTQATKDKFLAAAQHWTDKVGFKFVKRTNEKNYVSVSSANACSSFYGMIGGRQELKLGEDCSIGNAIHEIGHAVGLYHEQTRSDRDSYVNIFLENVIAGKEGNYTPCSNCVANGTLDFGSIMMYGSTFFSKNGKATMLKKDGSVINAQRNGLSENDIAIVNSRYK
jgi:hypothetical protein